MIAKNVKKDYLDERGPFVLPFGAIGDKPLGGGNHPIPGRGDWARPGLARRFEIPYSRRINIIRQKGSA